MTRAGLAQLISGGQTGADRAALDAALATGFDCGGYCPEGRRAEDGRIDARYPLTEIDGDYGKRTRMNVDAADGTLIFYRGKPRGGTEQTLACCIRRRKPYLLIDAALVTSGRAASTCREFIEARGIRVLNVAGPRASNDAGIYAYVYETVQRLLRELNG